MSPSGFDSTPGGAGKHSALAGPGNPETTAPGRSGFTLIEMLVTMVVAVILGGVTVRFYKDSYNTYSLQEQIADRNQNAQFTVSRLVEILQQAGTGLPATGWAVLKVSGSGALTIGSNPRGGQHFNGAAIAASQLIAVSDGTLFAKSRNPFLNPSHVMIDYAAAGTATDTIAIDRGCTTAGFVDGVKNNPDGTLDSLCLAKNLPLNVGDRIYGYREDAYLLSGGNLIIRPNRDASQDMVLAENIDSIGYTFLTRASVATTDWTTMRSASITVRARTERPDPKLPKPGYRKISLPMNVILRNKL